MKPAIVPLSFSARASAARRHCTSQRIGRVAGLILHNPPALRQLILHQHGWWNLWLLAGPIAAQIPADLESIANARVAHTRAIFLLAEQDEIVAPRFQRLVVDAYAGEKRVITLRGAYHNSPNRRRGPGRFIQGSRLAAAGKQKLIAA